MSETHMMATFEGWRGPLKEDKSEVPVSVRNETLCPATVPITQSSESICMWWTWGLELVLHHWNNWGTIGSSLTSSEEPWSGVPGPLESGSQPIAVGPEVDPEIWWVVPKDNPFSTGPIVCRWGRGWWVKEMATHSSVLAWRTPGTGEPGGLLSMGSQRVRHD